MRIFSGVFLGGFLRPRSSERVYTPEKLTAVDSGSPVDQTKWLVFRMIHGFRIPDPTNGQSLVDLDFLGVP